MQAFSELTGTSVLFWHNLRQHFFATGKLLSYAKNCELCQLVLSTNAITINAGYLRMPLSNGFKKENRETKDIKFPLPLRIAGTNIREIRIKPVHNARFFEVEYIYNFVQIPFWKFRRMLENLCKKYGINYIEQAESYTSKSSFLDRDILPEYNPENETKYTLPLKVWP